MARIRKVYRPMYDTGLFGPEWDSDYHRMLRLAEAYEGVVPVYVPMLRKIPRQGQRALHKVVYYLVDYDFTVDEVLLPVPSYRAPRKGRPIGPRKDDLFSYTYGEREYLTWSELPSKLVEDIRHQVYQLKRQELMGTPIHGGTR